MGIRYNVSGADRKALVKTIGEIVGLKPIYLGVPSCAYITQDFTVDFEGTLSFDDATDPNLVQRVLDGLTIAGFVPEYEQEERLNKLSISLPIAGLSEAVFTNLDDILESKGELIKKALDTDSLDYDVDSGAIIFPWFTSTEGEDVAAYTLFVKGLVDMAAKQKRVTAKSAPCESEKYAMRCFLLRLGFIGDEYKAARKVLLRNLTGSGSYAKQKPVNIT